MIIAARSTVALLKAIIVVSDPLDIGGNSPG